MAQAVHLVQFLLPSYSLDLLPMAVSYPLEFAWGGHRIDFTKAFGFESCFNQGWMAKGQGMCELLLD
jgi:hypothetical protein